MRTLRDRVGAAAPVFGVLLVLLVAIAVVNPSFLEPASLLAYLKRAAPLAILAVGQYFVIVSGEFDLSVGSLVTAEVVVAARLIDGDESATLPVIVLLAGLGLLIGLVNGLITTRLHVPSFITTLGMLLVLVGAVFLWTGGAPRGALSEAFRVLGRQGIDVPGFGQVPWSVLILIAVAAGAAVLMRSACGHTLLAIGDNDRAAALAGVPRRAGAHHRVRAVGAGRDRRRDPARRVRRRLGPGRARAWSSPPSPPSCSAASCSAAGAAPCSRRWPARSCSKPCSPCSTCSASPARWSPPCRA